jgi:hypothetical protein
MSDATKSARWVKAQVVICDTQGAVKCYWLKPLDPATRDQGTARAWRLTHQKQDHKPQSPPYVVSLTVEGETRCTCPAGQQHRPCKHVLGLQALGILDPSDWRRAFDACLAAEAEKANAQREAARWAEAASPCDPSLAAEGPAVPSGYDLPRGVAPGCVAYYGRGKQAGSVECRILAIVGERAKVVMQGKRRPSWVNVDNLCPF